MIRAVAVLCVLALAGCEAYRPASPDVIARAVYTSPEPASVTLVSMVNARTRRSAHSALIINGSQQVLYDPAGTFTHPDLPRADDIHYGMTSRYVDYYERYHSGFDYFVHAQKVLVPRATADALIARAQGPGQTMKLMCAYAVESVLQPVAPFTEVRTSIFPQTLRDDFARIAGVEERFVYEFDAGKNRVWEQSPTAPPM